MKMKKLLTLISLLAIFFLLHTPSCLADPVRIMMLGDSITGSPGCWRSILWQKLHDPDKTDLKSDLEIEFVGTVSPQGCGNDFDTTLWHEGHGGALATYVADNNELVDWLAKSNPDIVLMHFGTNDIWSNKPTRDILDAFTKLVGQMRDNNDKMIILVAQIIPVAPDFCKETDLGCYQPQGTINLNNEIPAWAQGLSTDDSPIIVVDQWTGFDTDTDTYDGVHPWKEGNEKIAENWYGPLVDVLNGETCSGSEITPNIRINDGALIQTDTASVMVGDNLILSPEAADGDNWSWDGPNDFKLMAREVFLYNIQTYQAGTYSLDFENNCGTVTKHDFTVSVQTQPQPENPEPEPNNAGGCDGSGPAGGCGWYN